MAEWLATVSLVLVAFAMVPAVAHALEQPGKRRLDEKTYMAVQAIYYPGFTLAGIAEPVAIIVNAALLVVARNTTMFAPALIAVLAMTAAHAVYWFVTHPVNKVWLRETKLARSGERFFAAGGAAGGDWIRLRDRWEHSHVARALLMFAAFIALAAGVS